MTQRAGPPAVSANMRLAFLAVLLVVVLGGSVGLLASTVRAPGRATVSPVSAVSPAVVSAVAADNGTPVPQLTPSPANGELATSTATPVDPTPTPDGRFSFLLLGYGGGNHDGSLLTDAVLLVIGDPQRKTLALLSFPRDIWTPLNLNGATTYGRLNTAFSEATQNHATPTPSFGLLGASSVDHFAGQFTVETVESIIGVPIDQYVALDFEGFREAIDAVDGIDVVVPNGFTAQYPRNDDPSIDPGWKIVSFAAGPQHMYGDRALIYTRARLTLDDSGEGSDFARAARQRIVLDAFRDKLITPYGLTRLPALLSIANGRTRTDYPIPAAADLATLLVSARDVSVYQATLGLDNYLTEATGPQGAYLLVPKAGGASWAQVRAFGRRFREDPATAQAIAGTRLEVVNRSGYPGLATRATARLEALGYSVGKVSESTVASTTTLIVNDSSSDSGRLLATALGVDLDIRGIDIDQTGTARIPATAVLELGADALEARAELPPIDSRAPSSAYGIIDFDGWLAPALPTAAPPPASTAVRGSATATGGPVRLSATSTPGAGTPRALTSATVTPASVSRTPSPTAKIGPALPSPPTATSMPVHSPIPSPTPRPTVARTATP